MVKKMVPEGALPAIYRRAQDPRRSARLITPRVTRGTALIVALVLSRGRGAPKPPSPSRRPVSLSLGVPGSVAARWSRASAPQEDDGNPAAKGSEGRRCKSTSAGFVPPRFLPMASTTGSVRTTAQTHVRNRSDAEEASRIRGGAIGAAGRPLTSG